MRWSLLIALAALIAIGIGACGSGSSDPVTTTTATATWKATCRMTSSTGADISFTAKSGVTPSAVTIKFYAGGKVIDSTSQPLPPLTPGETLGVVIFSRSGSPTPTSCRVAT
jgi:hypothetical protein